MDVHDQRRWREESYLMLVDSRKRDADVWPSPSHYAIPFKNHFDGVVELALLDATVPRAEYIVDDDVNELRYALGQPADMAQWANGAWAAGRERVARVDPGDYALPQFVVALNAALAAAAGPGEPAVQVATLSDPGEVKNKLVFRCAQPFVLLMKDSTMRYALGLGDTITAARAGEFATVVGWTRGVTGGASRAFCSVPTAPGSPGDVAADAELAFSGPVPAGFGVQRASLPGGDVRQRFLAAAGGTPRAVRLYGGCSTADAVASVRLVREADGATLATGAVTLRAASPAEAYEPRTASLTASAGAAGRVVAGTAYAIEVSALGAPGAYVYVNEPNAAIPDGATLTTGSGSAPAGSLLLCADVLVDSVGHAVVCPGVVDLSGPRYLSIHCEEVDSRMNGDRSSEDTHAGLGMVKLRGTGFREQRYDFVQFPPRRFHPVDKLSRLTFRLKRPDGTLYDSHGVDHTLLLGIKYRVPVPMDQVPRILNPNYVPDESAYLLSRLRREAELNDASRRNLM